MDAISPSTTLQVRHKGSVDQINVEYTNYTLKHVFIVEFDSQTELDVAVHTPIELILDPFRRDWDPNGAVLLSIDNN